MDMFDALRASGWPLAPIMQAGPGFHIGDRSWCWQPDEGEARCGSLSVATSVEAFAHAIVIRRTLTNHADAPSTPIDTIQPLALHMHHAPAEWTLLHAHGGTSEHYSPPDAFTHHQRFAVHERFRLSSHPSGRSSNQDLPLLLAHARGRDAGFFCGLEWSGRWQIDVTAESSDVTGLYLGVPVRGAVLAPGETLELPAVHLGTFAGDLETGGNALRRHIHQDVMPSDDGRPTLGRVSYDHWFGIRNEFDVELLKAQADRAAELGVEVFVHDAAWFEGGFPNGVGNWGRVDARKHPNGLEELADYVRRRGMDFGLWFEIERAGAGTQAVTEHPDWFVTCEDGIHLNLALPAAQDWAIETISHWIHRLDLRWSRWDYNINPGPCWRALDPTEKIQFDYMRGLYRVLDTLRQRHPKWMIETCASGGRRIDLGTLRRAHTAWISDHSESAYNCRYMQARANRFLPGCLLNSSVAVTRGHGDAGFDDAAILSRMLGKLAFDGDIASWSPALTTRYRQWVDVFKHLRHLLVQDFFQLRAQPRHMTDEDAIQFRDFNQTQSVVFAFAGSDGLHGSLPIRGLDGNCRVARLPDGTLRPAEGDHLAVALGPHEAAAWRIMHDGS